MSSAADQMMEPINEDLVEPGSFRDPSGYLFRRRGELYRQVNRSYQATFDTFVTCGLAGRLIDAGLLIRHEEVSVPPYSPEGYKVLKPEVVPFISYPYEWCFSQLKEAALLTLELQERALEHGMSLKDASAFNVQFVGSRPVFIDTLSFEPYVDGTPWVAYQQFCRHFLAPLALMAYRDVRLSKLMLSSLAGIPLDLASALLPFRTRLSLPLQLHIHLHARSQKRYAGTTVSRKRQVSKTALRGLIDNLRGAVNQLRWQPGGTEWADYYGETNYSPAAMSEKERIVDGLVGEVRPDLVWDLGANTGVFSRIARERRAYVVAFDIDPSAVEKNFVFCRKQDIADILPLMLDLTNPTPALGWALEERRALHNRGAPDLILALALIHHLAISNNTPMEQIAAFFARCAPGLIIEFVPKEDSQVRRLLASREDIFPDYNPQGFEASFSRWFSIMQKQSVSGSSRVLYLMQRRG